MIPYNMLVNIMKITKEKDIVKATLERTGHIPKKMSKEDNEELEKRLSYVENWIKDTNKIEISKAVLSKKQKKALKKLVKELKEKKWTEESLQTRLYDLAKEEEIPLKDFFKAAYLALLQNERGPRLAPFILAVGKAQIAKILEQVV